MSDKHTPIQSSADLTGIKLTEPADFAAGTLGIKVAMQHVLNEMGPIRGLQTLARMNQKKGFDCPGCAWPDPDDKRSVLGEYCENGAKALAEEATRRKVSPEFFQSHSINQLAAWSDFQIGKSGRITHPLIKKEGSQFYEEISWESAFLRIGEKLRKLDHADQAAFYTSGRSSNEAAFLYGIFARAYGTNNLPDCSNMCHETSGYALKQTTGIGKGSATLEDLHKAEVIIVMGQNPGTNHPRMLTALQKCKLNGGKIITINPLAEAGLKRFVNPQKPLDFLTGGTPITDVHLPVKINEDVALLKAIMKELKNLEKSKGGIIDHQFIDEKTIGFHAFWKDLDQYDTSDLLERSGITEADLKAAVDILASAKKIIICWAMGLTQHKNGVDNIRECVNLLLTKGSIGKRGAGTCPVRGHSNVQGDRSVGIMHYVSKPLNAAIKNEFGFTPPEKSGLDTVGAIKAMYEGKVKVFVSLGGNLAAAASDTNYTAKAFTNCELTVSISTKLNRTHLLPGKISIILPTLGRSEIDNAGGKYQFITVENSMGKVHRSTGNLPPASTHLLSEPEIVSRIAEATLGSKYKIPWKELGQNYDLIRNKIGRVVKGFEDYNRRVKTDSGFYLPNNARTGDFANLPQGKAVFSICPLPKRAIKAGDFVLMTIRSHDQFNTTIYGLDDRYRGVYNERRVIFMNKNDMEALSLQKLDIINVVSHYQNQRRIAYKFHVIPYHIPKGNLAGYFPELNPVVPIDEYANYSRTPASKSIVVNIEKWQK